MISSQPRYDHFDTAAKEEVDQVIMAHFKEGGKSYCVFFWIIA